ncbi:MAG: lantibiotic immunity ABC transporter MutE/EpiE family permease subunit [Tissierellia bacterium]|nr:lantibiotic immunity ABC transporter MutE/EpiE family permease subunit [Tissierellia bacterium]
MGDLILAEHLKCKRRFIKSCIILGPVIVLFHVLVAPYYFIANGYNWWYILILPGYISISASLLHQYEEKLNHYRGILTLPLSLEKTWLAKIILLVIYLWITSLIHLSILCLGKGTILVYVAKSIPYRQMILGSFVLFVTHLWQIPFCLFLSKKIGMAFTILVHVVLGTMLNIIFATKSLWWISPYSWGSRLMVPILGVLPNGLIAEKGETMVTSTSIPLGILLSILFFLALSFLTMKWFQRQEGN